MPGLSDFMKKYGDVPFSELPFGDLDSVSLCHAFYMPVEKAVKYFDLSSPVPFKNVCFKAFEINGNRHRPVGLILNKQISIRLMEIARNRRYKDLMLADLSDVFQTDPAIQFTAATILLPDNTAVVLFRGTDDSIIGWKEDLDILVKKGMPSHRLAVEYLERTAEKFDGDIIICGHSKGGNLALYSALKCKKETRDRIRRVYNFDGPGFYTNYYYSTDAYYELLPGYRHFVPQSSFIGMLLAHDDDYTIVKSSRFLGPLQHDLSTWQVRDSEFLTKKRLSLMGKINDVALSKMVEHISPDHYPMIEKVANEVVQGLGQLYLRDFAKHIDSSLKGARNAWANLDEETKESFVSGFGDPAEAVRELVKDTVDTVVSQEKERVGTVINQEREKVETVLSREREKVETVLNREMEKLGINKQKAEAEA